MDDVSGVGGFERVGNLDTPIQHLLDHKRLATDAVLQCLAFEKLHGDERDPVRFANVINGANVRMVQGRSCLRLSPKTRYCMQIFRYVVG